MSIEVVATAFIWVEYAAAVYTFAAVLGSVLAVALARILPLSVNLKPF